jgi:hypothetical protein
MQSGWVTRKQLALITGRQPFFEESLGLSGRGRTRVGLLAMNEGAHCAFVFDAGEKLVQCDDRVANPSSHLKM